MSFGQPSLRRYTTLQNIFLAVSGSVLLAACGGSSNSGGGGGGGGGGGTPTTYTVGGTASGLNGSSSGLVLQDNSKDDLTVSASTFTFATGLVSGATYSVSVKTQPTGQTCMVANGSGTIGSANVTNVAVTCTSSATSDKIGGNVSGLNGTGLKLQDNGGDDLVVGTTGPFTFATPLASGKPYLVTVSQQPTSTPAQYCTVSAGSGTTGTGDVTSVKVTCRNMGQYLFTTVHTSPAVTNGLITMFAIDPATGIPSRQLRHTPFSTEPWGIALDTSGKYAYVSFVNDSNSQLGSVTFDPTVPSITDNDDAHTLGADASMFATATDPAAAYVYVGGTIDATRSQGEIFGYSVALGKVTPVGTEVDLDGGWPYTLAVDPAGKFLFAPQPANGAPTPQPSGTPDVWVYQINADGSLTAVTGAPFPFQAGGTTNTPFGVAVNPNGGYVYITDNTADTVTAYSYSAAGVLAEVGTPQAVGQDPTGVAVDPTGQFLYVTNADEATVSAFTINATTGTLTAVGSPVPTGASRSTVPTAIQVDPSGQYVYVANGADATVAAFSINRTTGALTEIGSVSGDPQSATGSDGGSGSSALAIE